MEYKEDVLAERLYYSRLPTDTMMFPSYECLNNCALLQEVFSSVQTSKYYFIRAVPDLIFSCGVPPTGTTKLREVPSTGPTEIPKAASAIVVLYDEPECLLESIIASRQCHCLSISYHFGISYHCILFFYSW